MTRDEKITIIAHHYGFIRQKEICVEECAELIQAIKKWQRASSSEADASLYNVKEELADVTIMCSQLSELTGKREVERIIEEKLGRQLRRIAEEDKRL